jgi:hypothetical protein
MGWNVKRSFRRRPTRGEPPREAGGDSSGVPVQIAEGDSPKIAGGDAVKIAEGDCRRVPVHITGGHAGGQVQLGTPEMTTKMWEAELNR